MTRDEVKKILMRIQTTYPNWKPQADLSLTIDVWYEYLGGFSYDDILCAVKSYVLSDSSGFAPSVGQLINQLHKMTDDSMNDMEAWALVSKAIRNGYYGAEEEFNKLPPLVQKAVGQPSNIRNWSQSDLKTIETVIMSQFQTSYRVEKKKAEESKLISNVVSMGMKENIGIEMS